MLGLLEKIFQAKLATERGDVAQVTISLPLDDPRARRLAALAKRLMLPTTRIHKSGLTTETGMVVPERADEFIDALRKEVGDEIMADLTDDLRTQIELRKKQKLEGLPDSLCADGQQVASLVKGVLTDPLVREGFLPHERESFGNIADALRNGEISL